MILCTPSFSLGEHFHVSSSHGLQEVMLRCRGLVSCQPLFSIIIVICAFSVFIIIIMRSQFRVPRARVAMVVGGVHLVE
jgi:hypothetical protein